MPDVLISFIAVFTAAAAALFVIWLLAKRWRLRAIGGRNNELKVEELAALDGSWRVAIVSAADKKYLALYGPGGACLSPLDREQTEI